MKTKPVVNQTITQFLRSEAKKSYANLPVDVRARTSKQKIYSIMKKAWKEGDDVRREHRQENSTSN